VREITLITLKYSHHIAGDRRASSMLN